MIRIGMDCEAKTTHCLISSVTVERVVRSVPWQTPTVNAKLQMMGISDEEAQAFYVP